jgi:hypothetical protein
MCIVCEINSKIFFLADIFFLGGVLVLCKYIFPRQACFIRGSSQISVFLILVKLISDNRVFKEFNLRVADTKKYHQHDSQVN